MDEPLHHPHIRLRRKHVRLVQEQSEVIRSLFNVRVCPTKTKKDGLDSSLVLMPLEAEQMDADGLAVVAAKLQSYVDTLCSTEHEVLAPGPPAPPGVVEHAEGEDSSYDSDYEAEDGCGHHDVSRTVSDTLGAEFAEYVSVVSHPTSHYAAKLEFGLKLGYPEKLVHTALGKLGTNTGQNELLAELIKLGAQSPRLADLEGEDECRSGGAEESMVDEGGWPNLRPVVVDGSNVAMSHGGKEVFSCRGIKICVDWFRARGHRDITVFVPTWRKQAPGPDNLITEQELLVDLERERVLVFTPSRVISGKRTVCYDDRYVLNLAVQVDGVVVSNDSYRDLAQENQEFRRVVEERILMYSFVNDRFMPPDDPLGRSGPTLANFLRIQPKRSDPPPPCPYGKKCTYGNKCKYHHPERGALPLKSVTERLVERAQKHWQIKGSRDSSPGGQVKGKSLSVPLSCEDHGRQHGVLRKTPLSRTKSGVPTTNIAARQVDERVSKSKSVENIVGESRGARSHWGGSRGQYSGQHTPVAPRLSDPEPLPAPPQEKLHRKLQRQLTLNPAYDPRLQEMRGYTPAPPQAYWEHPNVTRIASAPDSYRGAPPPTVPPHMHRLSSASDPQINLCDHWMPPWLQQQPCSMHPPLHHGGGQYQQQAALSAEEARRKLHYHLANIFPEEQVRAALQMYPEETKPQEICAAILTMFPQQ